MGRMAAAAIDAGPVRGARVTQGDRMRLCCCAAVLRSGFMQDCRARPLQSRAMQADGGEPLQKAWDELCSSLGLVVQNK